MGDSLSAGYGMQSKDGWVRLLETQLDGQGYDVKIINASISGETSGGGLRRFPELLEKHQPNHVILELGANDGLRGQSLKTMRANLSQMVQQSQSANATVLVLGMMIPPNYGRKYTERFHQSFQTVAKENNAALVDFFLAPLALQPNYFQADRVHPNEAAQPLLVEHLWPNIKQLVSGQ
ncbi:MAG: acyl-CoA thioesterase-1 [Pseudoalteromonas tetraodonis]|jgi:acyl-CoA thioesterase-1